MHNHNLVSIPTPVPQLQPEYQLINANDNYVNLQHVTNLGL